MTGDSAADPTSDVVSSVPPFRVPGATLSEADADRIANTTVEYGWYAPVDRVMVPIDDHAVWEEHRLPSTQAALHAWEPLDPFLVAHSADPEHAALPTAVTFAHQWLDLGLDPSAPDLGVAGRRALRLAYLAAVADDARLTDGAGAHIATLSRAIDPTEPTPATMDAITGLVTLVGRTSADPQAAADLLTSHLSAAFTPDGMHRSQSPGVQRHVLDCLSLLVESDLIAAELVAEIREQAEQTLAWFVDPDGFLANFGATPRVPISTAYADPPTGVRFLPDRIADPAMLHAASAGRFGTAPDRNRRILHDGGFFIVKEPWPSRSDDAVPTAHLVARTGPPSGSSGVEAGLAFTWYERGRSIIIEPGPAAVGSDHPAARYADEPRAHNRIVVGPAVVDDDDETDPAERPMEPGPSLAGGLQRWGLMEGHYFCDSFDASDVVRHRRSLMYEPGSWLIVADVIDTADGRTAGPRFHLADDLTAVADGDRFTIVDRFDPVAWAVPLAPHVAVAPQRGTIEPAADGWWSPTGTRMMPNWIFGWDAAGPSTFVTLLAVDERPEVVPPDGAWFGWHTTSYRARVAVTEWGIVDIDIQRRVEEGG